jgi:hypothetical protein
MLAQLWEWVKRGVEWFFRDLPEDMVEEDENESQG